MKSKKNKFTDRILIASASIIVIVFGLNWYLTHRLESYLRSQLSAIVADASEGFYKFTFKELHIGLFDGELSIGGIEFMPDSAVFDLWKKNDSLPENYYKVKVDLIDFKGLNLTWRINYKNLGFKLFEVKNPRIEVYQPYYSVRENIEPKNQKEINLHNLISPYIDVLSVKDINLEHAHVSYTLEDSVQQSVYALNDVTFKAYGFRLDSESYTSGKLLYCDNFEFVTNQPQVLMQNNIFRLTTESIRLSTQDSLISIGESQLSTQKELIDNESNPANSYVNALLSKVEVNGIHFRRENAMNYLDARSFIISSPDIEYYINKKDSVPTKKNQRLQELTPENIWSLYSLISPILHQVSINDIGIRDAKMTYLIKMNRANDQYTLNHLDFDAKGFLVDSLADKEQRFLYSESFTIKAKDITGNMVSQNHNFQIGEMSLDMEEGLFEIEDVKIYPISNRLKTDLLNASFSSLKANGLEYDNGFKVNEISLNSPSFEYTLTPYHVQKKEITVKEPANNDNISKLINYFINYLSVSKININQANFILNDKKTNNRYKLKNFDFRAETILLNDSTMKESPHLFTYGKFMLSFSNFDNLSPDKNYRLTIGRGVLDSEKKFLLLKNFNLIPLVGKWETAPSTHIGISSPYIYLGGITYKANKSGYDFLSDSLIINNPDVVIVKNTPKEEMKASEKSSQNADININKIFLGGLRITNPKFKFIDHTTNDTLITRSKRINLKSLAINPNKETLELKNFNITNVDFYIKQSDNIINANTQHLGLSDILFNSKTFKVGKFMLQNPNFYASLVSDKKTDSIRNRENEGNINIYDALSSFREKIEIGEFDIKDADIDLTFNKPDNALRYKYKPVSLNFAGLAIDTDKRTFNLRNLDFEIKDLEFPLMDGFYTLKLGNIDISKQKGVNLLVENIHLLSKYPKMEFAYQHPKHKDWFDVTTKSILLSDIDLSQYVFNNTLKARSLTIQDVILENFKNQQIEIEHNIMPMIYEGLQKLPLGLDIDTANVYNFNVVYEELAKQGTIPGKFFISDMNGYISKLTNRPFSEKQFIKVQADGMLMGNAKFDATWLVPASSSYDRFLLNGTVDKLELTDLNQIVTPLAPARINSGTVENMMFQIDASSKGATINMLFPYNDLNISVMKSLNSNYQNKFVSGLANSVLRKNNPNKPDAPIRRPHIVMERDPYHSTFNYFLQIFRPALIESVGVPKKTQDFFKNVSSFFGKVKNLFKPKEKEEN
ncbi:hypothetical protein [Dysgonomonas sp. 520]|uniref:hypothetical protein n=1 Tax=Dysgonomonas sp. 520 TaxID=2302931 RepID=UPI0013D2CDC6|nr:hypothetical protein [Dysgonomonas sp. 520]